MFTQKLDISDVMVKEYIAELHEWQNAVLELIPSIIDDHLLDVAVRAVQPDTMTKQEKIQHAIHKLIDDHIESRKVRYQTMCE